MSLLQNGFFCHGFDFTNSITQIFSAQNTPTIGTQFARFPAPSSSYVSQGANAAFGQVFWLASGSIGNPQTIVTGFAFQCTQQTLSQDCIVFFYDWTAGQTQCYLGLNATNQLQFYQGNSGFPNETQATLGPAGATILKNTWYYIECKVTIATSGLVECRLNGTTTISFTGNTKFSSNSWVQSLNFGQVSGVSTATNHMYDDWYILDTTGPLNTYLGDSRVRTLVPIGDSLSNLNAFSTNPVQSTGNHFKNVVGYSSVGTAYNFDATPGDRESYRVGGLSGSPSIYALNIWANVEKDDANSRSFAITQRNNGVDVIGATITSPSSYALFNQVSFQDPNTGQIWTPAGFGTGAFSNAEFGVKVIS